MGCEGPASWSTCALEGFVRGNFQALLAQVWGCLDGVSSVFVRIECLRAEAFLDSRPLIFWEAYFRLNSMCALFSSVVFVIFSSSAVCWAGFNIN